MTAKLASSIPGVRHRALGFGARALVAIALFTSVSWAAASEGPSQSSNGYRHPKHGALGEIGSKLADPTSDVWALSTSLSLPEVFDGDLNTGDPKLGASVTLQPVLPIPLFGSGSEEWRLITRPIVPIVFSAPVPKGIDDFATRGGLGDMQLPLVLTIPQSIAGHWLLAAGPVGLFPTATNGDLGKDQWALGPAVVIGYQTKTIVAGVFPNYFFKVGSAGQRDRTPDIHQGSLLYFFNVALPGAWQFGFDPTISYDHEASKGNRWTVPVGLYIGRTVTLGGAPVNIKAGLEYSVVSPDQFGTRTQFRLQVTPVIPSLIENALFGD